MMESRLMIRIAKNGLITLVEPTWKENICVTEGCTFPLQINVFHAGRASERNCELFTLNFNTRNVKMHNFHERTLYMTFLLLCDSLLKDYMVFRCK